MTLKVRSFLKSIGLAIAITACSAQGGASSSKEQTNVVDPTVTYDYSAQIILAGGCFWCVESDFEKLDGIGDVISGFSGGEMTEPTYRNHGRHIEAALIPYDPSVFSYRELVDYFLRHIDPFDDGGQFCDRGHEYTTAIFYADENERVQAEAARSEAESLLGQPIVTPAVQAGEFWPAEDYHQNFYKTNPIRYNLYRQGCGRDARVEEIWGTVTHE